jgi:Xaa-Pro aminopeptidase
MRLVPLMIAAVLTLQAGEIGPAAFQARRELLKKSLPDSVVVLFGSTEADSGLRSSFFQEPNFYYLSGWAQPGAILLMDPSRDVLFLPKKDTAAEKWTGPKASPADVDIQSRTGFTTVLPADAFESELRKSLEHNAHIYTLSDAPQRNKLALVAPFAEISDLQMPIARLRMKKSPEEIALIQHSTDVSILGHRAAWRRLHQGLYEYQIAATMTGLFMDHGCERTAYAPIVASGPNAATLHYSALRRQIDGGEMVLMDVAAECSGYASDITRTVPVSGKFTERQREIYDIVLGAQKAAIAAIKPGVMIGQKSTPGSLNKIAQDYIEAHGYGKYFTHGLSHPVGLDVHDPYDPALPLEAGDVITIEPGIYIPEEKLGIRIEDVVLVTDEGAKVLSDALPREAEEIEKTLRP